MRKKELLQMRVIGLTDEIRNMALADEGRKIGESGHWGGGVYTEFNVRKYVRAEIEGGILKVEIYWRQDIREGNEKPLYRIYLSAEENRYTTYLQEEGRWSQARIKNMPDYNYIWRHGYKKQYWAPKEEEKLIKTYLAAEDKEKGLGEIIDDWQMNTRHRKEIAEIDRVMCQITESPADFGLWARREAFWGKQYLFYDARKQEAYCTACERIVKTKIKGAHNRKVICPACGREVTAKAWKKQKQIGDGEDVALIQRIPEGIIVRKFICTKSHRLEKNWRENFYMYERERYLFTERMILQKCYEYTCFKNYGPLRWCNGHSGYIGSAVVYPGTIQGIREGTELKDIPLEIMMEREKGERVWIEKLLRPGKMTGYLIHAGLTKLARQCLNSGEWQADKKGKTAQEALGISKDRIDRLKRINGGMTALGWLRFEEKKGKKIPQETLGRLEKEDLRAQDLEDILLCGVTPARALNYLEKQHGRRSNVLTEWKDYLWMAERSGRDTSDDIVRYPKDLHRRHNELVELENQRKKEEEKEEYKRLDKKIWRRLPEAARYYWEDKEYMIIPAAKCEELIEEGRTLHHCVGAGTTYMNKMAAGRTWILFLRRKEDVDDPWYTIEIDMETDAILQWYSAYDRRPECQKVGKILDKFLRSVKKKREKERLKAGTVQIAATA